MKAQSFYYVWLSEAGTYIEIKGTDYQRLIDLGFTEKVDEIAGDRYVYLHMDHS